MFNSRENHQRTGERLQSWLLAALLAFPLAAPAYADTDPANDSDSITVSLTPLVDIGVSVDTDAVNLGFTMEMGASAFTTSPATLTLLGTFAPLELDVAGANNSAAPVWTLDADEAAAQDELRLYMLFSVDRDSAPLSAEFAGAKNLVTGAVKRAGTFSGAAADGSFENNAMLGGADMDNLNPAQQRQLWLRIDTPPTTSTAQQQDIQITFTATKDDL